MILLEEALFADTFSFWEKITEEDKRSILEGSVTAEYKKGQLMHRSDIEMPGGQLLYYQGFCGFILFLKKGGR